ncbi:MAG: hypothetical protein ABI868_21740 [Acidobacteriota bacterium]
METPRDQSQDVIPEPAIGTTESTKEAWVKPEIVDFKPVTVARGISYRIGDGLSNLSA